MTHEVLFTDHLTFPVVSHQRRRPLRGNWGICSNRKYKSELKGLGGIISAAVARALSQPITLSVFSGSGLDREADTGDSKLGHPAWNGFRAGELSWSVDSCQIGT